MPAACSRALAGFVPRRRESTCACIVRPGGIGCLPGGRRGQEQLPVHMRLTRPGIQTMDVHTFLIIAPAAAVPASGAAFRLGVSVEPDVLARTRMRVGEAG